MNNVDETRINKEILDKYDFDRNTFKLDEIKNSHKDKENHFKDEINVLVGDDKEDNFLPQVKLCRWSNEVNFSIRRKEYKDSEVKTDKDKIVWENDDEKIEFYDFEERDRGGYKLVWFLKNKPKKNKIEFTIQSKGLNFYYQPEITNEEAQPLADEKGISLEEARREIRPENVVGSYAVYHETKGGCNEKNGKDYKAGKAFHVYRPHIIDAEGKETWGILNIENGIYSIEISQEFLDKAVYPIKSNDTFGYTSEGSSTDWWSANNNRGYLYSASKDGKIEKFSVYAFEDKSGDLYSKGVLMDASDKDTGGEINLVTDGITNASLVPAGSGNLAWYDETFSTAPSVSNGVDYVLVTIVDSGTANFGMKYDTGTNDYYYGLISYTDIKSWGTTWTTGSKRKFSVYATYEEASGPDPITLSIDTLVSKTEQKSFSADSFLQTTVSKDFSIDTLIQATSSKTFSVDTLIKTESIKEFSLDSLLKTTETKTFSIDALLKKIETKEFSLDNLAFLTVSKEFAVDTLSQVTASVSLSIDTLLKETLSKDISIDSFIFKVSQKDFSIDSLFKKTQTKQFDIDSLVGGAGEVSFSVDSLLSEEKTTSFYINTLIGEVETWRIPTDGDFQDLERYLGMSEAEIALSSDRGTDEGAALAGVPSFWSSGDLKNDTRFGETGFDCVPAGYYGWAGSEDYHQFGERCLLLTKSEDGSNDYTRSISYTSPQVARQLWASLYYFSIRLVRAATSAEVSDVNGTVYEDDYQGHNNSLYDSIKLGNQVWLAKNLAETEDSTGTAITNKKEPNGSSANVSDYGYLYDSSTLSILAREDQPTKVTKAFSIDTLLKTTVSKVFSVDTLIQSTPQKTFSVDALVKTENTKEFSLDSLFLKVQEKSFDIDSFLIGVGVTTFEISTSLSGVESRDFSVDTYILEAGVTSFNLDTFLFELGLKEVSIDSLVFKQEVKQFSVDTSLSSSDELSFSIDSLIKKTSEKEFDISTYSIFKITKTFSIDSCTAEKGLKTFALDAYLLDSWRLEDKEDDPTWTVEDKPDEDTWVLTNKPADDTWETEDKPIHPDVS